MILNPLIDIQLDRGTATNQIPVWNDTTKRFVPQTTLTGITLGSPWVLSGDGSLTGALQEITANDSNKFVLLGTKMWSFASTLGNNIFTISSSIVSSTPIFQATAGIKITQGEFIGTTTDLTLIQLIDGLVKVDGNLLVNGGTNVTELHVFQKADGPSFGTGVPATGIRVNGFDDRDDKYLNMSIEDHGLGVIGGTASTIYFSPSNIMAVFFSSDGIGVRTEREISLGSTTSDNTRIGGGSEQTAGATIMLAVNDNAAGSTQGRAVIVCDVTDRTFDFAHPDQTNPTLFIHSSAQSTTQWLGLAHNGSSGVISSGLGGIVIPNNVRIGDNTAPVNETLEVVGHIGIVTGNEQRYYETDNTNYVGFKAGTLAGNQIWTLPLTDGDPGAVLTTDGAGITSWTDNASEKTWAFMSRDASSGTNYIGGFYKFGATDNDFDAPAITFGTANISYAAHFFLVQAAGASGGTDTVVRVNGTTIDDLGNRNAGVNVDITVDDAGAAGTYYETIEKWLGQVTISKLSGPDLLCNYGYAKYWDNNNTDFKVAGIEATWLGAKNDANPDIILLHHRPTGWTYNAGSTPTHPTEIDSMNGDHVTEIQIGQAQEGAWKRDNLSEDINGSAAEGTIIKLITTTNRTYAIGNFLVRITPQ